MRKNSSRTTNIFAVFVIGPFCKNNSENLSPLFVIRTKVRALDFLIGRNSAVAGLPWLAKAVNGSQFALEI